MKKKEQKPDQDVQRLLAAGKIKAILCAPKKFKYMSREANIILFEDGQTYIELEEQDYYSYHDCSSSARHINVRQDERLWKMYLKDYVPALSIT